MSYTETQPKTATELFPGRLSIGIPEFCKALGWNRARFYRHRDKIKTIDGFGRPMIPVYELARLLGQPHREGATDAR
jgi:hypothetical protein